MVIRLEKLIFEVVVTVGRVGSFDFCRKISVSINESERESDLSKLIFLTLIMTQQ